MKNKRFLFFAVALLTVFCSAFALDVQATTFTVTNLNDSGAGSLAQAVLDANSAPGDDTIVFQEGFTGTINIDEFNDPGIDITTSMTIIGPGARLLTISGIDKRRVFTVRGSGITVSISGLTVANGKADSFSTGLSGGGIYNASGATLNLDSLIVRNNRTTGAGGGGISNRSGSTMNITNSTISNNTAAEPFYGGGISNTGVLNIANSTISGNSATGSSGLDNLNGTVTLNNVTITNNTSSATSGAAVNNSFTPGSASTMLIRNTIIAKNNSPNKVDIYGGTSQGNNLIGASPSFTNGVNGDKVGTATEPLDPLLEVLANNGGTTDTHALLSGSPAVNAGNNCVVTASCPSANPPFALSTDQNGSNRVQGAIIDIGAFESAFAPTAASVTVSGRVLSSQGRGIRNVTITLTDSNGNDRTTQSTAFGNYRFDDVAAGETVTLSAKARQFKFNQSTIVRTANESIADADFVSER